MASSLLALGVEGAKQVIHCEMSQHRRKRQVGQRVAIQHRRCRAVHSLRSVEMVPLVRSGCRLDR